MMNTAAQLAARFATAEPRSLCIIKPSSLGDVVQALPVLAALRTRFPKAHISWVVNRSYAGLLEPIPLIDRVIAFDRDAHRGQVWGSAAAFARLLQQLRGAGFDLAVDLQGLLRSGIMSLASGAAIRIGLASAREGARLAYTHLADDRKTRPNAVERYWTIAELIGVGHLPKQFPLWLQPSEVAWAAGVLAGLPSPRLAVHAGARWRTKQWPAEHFAQTVDAVLRPGGSAVLLGSAGERPIVDALARRLGVPFVDLCGKTSLRQLAAVLQMCDIAFSNDSGPMHLAAAVGTRTVSVFTCTSPERAAPFGTPHLQVATSVPCRGSYRKTCSHLSCMKELGPPKVIPVLTEAIAKANGIGKTQDETEAAA